MMEGTVIELRPKHDGHPHLKWLVTIKVDSVLKGRFDEQTFSFSIHSPTKSNIVIGSRCMIHVARTQTGEYQFYSLGSNTQK